MRLLLTSAGVKNASIDDALVGLLGKPIAESSALVHSDRGVRASAEARRGVAVHQRQERRTPMCELGWKSLGVLELTALPSIGEERWVPWSRGPTSCWWTAAMPCT